MFSMNGAVLSYIVEVLRLLLLSYSKAPWRLTVDFVLTFDIQC